MFNRIKIKELGTWLFVKQSLFLSMIWQLSLQLNHDESIGLRRKKGMNASSEMRKQVQHLFPLIWSAYATITSREIYSYSSYLNSFPLFLNYHSLGSISFDEISLCLSLWLSKALEKETIENWSNCPLPEEQQWWSNSLYSFDTTKERKQRIEQI